MCAACSRVRTCVSLALSLSLSLCMRMCVCMCVLCVCMTHTCARVPLRSNACLTHAMHRKKKPCSVPEKGSEGEHLLPAPNQGHFRSGDNSSSTLFAPHIYSATYPSYHSPHLPSNLNNVVDGAVGKVRNALAKFRSLVLDQTVCFGGRVEKWPPRHVGKKREKEREREKKREKIATREKKQTQARTQYRSVSLNPTTRLIKSTETFW